MAVDVMGNPPFETTELRWYKPAHTTPFALCGHIGPVLAHVPADVYGGDVIEAWFSDDGWEYSDGRPFDEVHILAWAIPAAPKTEETPPTDTEPCPDCNDTGELFIHADDCDDDLCALNGDEHSCGGQVVPCARCGTATEPKGAPMRRNDRRAVVEAKKAMPAPPVTEPPAVVGWPDDDEPDLTCPRCGGDGGDPMNDYIMPCPHCDGEGYEWWRS